MNRALTIVRLVVRDFKRITAIEVEPKSSGLVRIRGRNAQGKSSVLDAIEAAICGKRSAPAQPVRAGAERAEINVDLGDVQIRRRFTANGGMTLKIDSKNPAQKQVQGALDALYKQVSVDPGAFIRLGPKEQAEQLRAAMGLDTAPLDQAREDTFAERTLVGREVSRLEGALAETPFPAGPDEPVDVAKLAGELVAIGNAERMRDQWERSAAEKQKAIDQAEADVAYFENELREARQRMANERSALNVLVIEKVHLPEVKDAAPVHAQIADAEQTNAAVRARQKHRELDRELTAKRDEYQQLTRDIAGIDAEKERMLSEARFPIPGVGLQGDTVTLNHVPLDQASQAERLRFATALAISLKPEMPVILIRDGSLLDDDSMRVLEEMAVTAGAQVWIEEVGTESSDDAILIEDGSLVEVS